MDLPFTSLHQRKRIISVGYFLRLKLHLFRFASRLYSYILHQIADKNIDFKHIKKSHIHNIHI